MNSGSDPNSSAPGDSRLRPSSTAAPAEPSPPLPEREIDEYRLIEVIGEGGMGVIYKAEQRGALRRVVALKVVKLGLDTRAVIARFEAERQALALMNHPNIARVYGAGSTSLGRPYFVMEYVPGEPITAYCDRHRLPIRQRLELFEKVCDAVQHAHTKGIIHRDLKATNVLVAEVDRKPVPKVIDFGVAKAMNQRLTEETLFTESGLLVGTPAYTSPEQADGGADVDTRSDVYSLGVLLYELLTGSLPFDPVKLRGMAYGEMQRIIREVDPPRPSTFYSNPSQASRDAAQRRAATVEELASTLRHELEWIPLRAMRKGRHERYQTATDLARDIDNYLAGKPLIAAPDSRLYRLKKGLRRHRGLAAAAAVVAVTLLLGLGLTTWQADRANDQKLLAQESAAEARHRLAQAEASARLFRELFQGIRPNVVAGKDPELLIAVLRSAEPKIEQILTEPAWRVEHLILLGEAFRLLGDYEHARDLLERARRIAQDGLASDGGDFEDELREARNLIEALDRLAAVHIHLRAYPEAVELRREAMALCEAHLPPGDRTLTELLANLANALRLAGNLTEAESLHRRALDRAGASPEDYPPVDRAVLASNLGTLRYAQGDYAGADEAFQIADDLLAEAGMTRSSEYAMLLSNRAALAVAMAEPEQALRLVTSAIDLRQAAARDVNPLLLCNDLELRSRIQESQRRFSEAADDLAQALRIRREVVKDPSLAGLDVSARNSEHAGYLFLEAGRPADAITLIQEAISLYQQAEALARAESAEAGRSADPAAQAPDAAKLAGYRERILATQQRWAQVSLQLGDHVQALPAIQACLQEQRELYRDNRSPEAVAMLATSQWILAEAMLSASPAGADTSAALQMLLDAFESLEQSGIGPKRSPAGRPGVHENIARRLVSLYEALGDEDQAQLWSARLSKLSV